MPSWLAFDDGITEMYWDSNLQIVSNGWLSKTDNFVNVEINPEIKKKIRCSTCILSCVIIDIGFKPNFFFKYVIDLFLWDSGSFSLFQGWSHIKTCLRWRVLGAFLGLACPFIISSIHPVYSKITLGDLFHRVKPHLFKNPRYADKLWTKYI